MSLTAITAYLPLPQGIATSGQPTEAQFAEIKAAGYDLVINLAMPSSENWLENEAEILAALGLDYVPLPVQWDYPTLGDAEQFFEQLTQQSERKIWVHCALNMRVSAMMYLYHRIYQAMPEREASQYLNRIWIPNGVWQNFIDAVIELYGE
jgi:protein tyrosine phosphatase (PTP) superfamily phosphohydrolase (DUF442 family)